MLFKGRKHKDFPKQEKVSIEDTKEFDHTMRSPSSDIYICLVNLVGQVVLKIVQNRQILEVYREYAHLGSEDGACALPNHREQDLAINITPRATPLYQPLYSLSATELEILRKYLADYLQRS
jgi:hypothetical protein